MEKFVVNGGKKLKGEAVVSGAKNVALKVLVAACLTDEEVIIENVPLISSFFIMLDIIRELGGEIEIKDHTVRIKVEKFKKDRISLERAAEVRTSSMFVAPLLQRLGRAVIPNPGGCRIGARPIDRIIEGLEKMGAVISYDREDGYFHAKTEGLKGIGYRFKKNTHTGTETLILAAVLAKGRTILENAAEEPEVDELISLLNKMGANVRRSGFRRIIIHGVNRLNGARFCIGPDRNEIVTLAVASILTEGDILIKGSQGNGLSYFLDTLDAIGSLYEKSKTGIRFFNKGNLKPVDITTSIHPGFMTDWQGPLAVLLTQAKGISTIHETVYENRFGYVEELKKMGADIELFRPKVSNPDRVYNFNRKDDKKEYYHAVRIKGPSRLHNAVLTMTDIRAGATLVLAALAAKGKSIILGIEHLDRGYESFDERLKSLGADIKRVKE